MVPTLLGSRGKSGPSRTLVVLGDPIGRRPGRFGRVPGPESSTGVGSRSPGVPRPLTLPCFPLGA